MAVRTALSLHDNIVLQVLTDASQKYPDDDIQLASPHLQSIPAVFDVIPVVIAQVVGGRIEQEWEEATQ